MASDPFSLRNTVIDGRYSVGDVIGEGGFGVVYRGHHLAFDHAIAIKCLKVPGHFSSEGKLAFLQKFKDEGKVLSKLSHHPAIVRVFDFGVVPSSLGEVPYLVLEWLQGRPLSDLVTSRKNSGHTPFSETEALELLRPIIDALAIVHEEGIAHRDIKPDNIFISDAGKGSPVKLLDFGIAKAMQEGDRVSRVGGQTTSQFNAFSPQYGAPEQFRPGAFGATGPWTDVHAIGLLFGELLSGQTPIDGSEFGDQLVSATNEVRPTPRALGAAATDALEAIMGKALALDPRVRFQNARDLLTALDARAVGAAELAARAKPDPGSSTSLLRTGVRALPANTIVASPNTFVPTATGGMRARLPRYGALALAILALVAVTLTVGFLTRRNRDSALTSSPMEPPTPTATDSTAPAAPQSATHSEGDCELLANDILVTGDLSPRSEAFVGTASDFVGRLAYNKSLTLQDLGPDNPPMPCKGTSPGTRIEDRFANLVLGKGEWMKVEADLSPYVRGVVLARKLSLDKNVLIAAASYADTAADAALRTGSNLAKAQRRCSFIAELVQLPSRSCQTVLSMSLPETSEPAPAQTPSSKPKPTYQVNPGGI